MTNPLDKIHMLTQPLTTEEGFLNEACMNELNAFIRNIPETFERLKDEPEWNIKRYTTDIEILGTLANSAINQFGGMPPNLDIVINYTHVLLKKNIFPERKDNDHFSMAQLSLCDINKLLWDYLGDVPEFNDWSDNKYKHYMSLSACLHDVCITIRNRRRHGIAFNVQFEREMIVEINTLKARVVKLKADHLESLKSTEESCMARMEQRDSERDSVCIYAGKLKEENDRQKEYIQRLEARVGHLEETNKLLRRDHGND